MLTWLFKIAQDIHHTILETRFDIQNITIVEDDRNLLWENINDDSDNSILQARRQMNNIKNEEKQSLNLIDEDRLKKTKQVVVKNRKHFLMSKFHVVQNIWQLVIKSLAQKIKHLNLCELQCWTCVSLSLVHVSAKFYDSFYDNFLSQINSYIMLCFYCCCCFFYDNLYDNFMTIVFWYIVLQKEKVYDTSFSHLYFSKKKRAI